MTGRESESQYQEGVFQAPWFCALRDTLALVGITIALVGGFSFLKATIENADMKCVRYEHD
jgi:hypothetical protein